jgi:hypothetical protein
MGDRTGWIKDKVTHSLGVSESVFNELLERQGPDGKSHWQGLNDFLDHEGTIESVVMFYTTEEMIGGPEGALGSVACTLPPMRRARLSVSVDTWENGS